MEFCMIMAGLLKIIPLLGLIKLFQSNQIWAILEFRHAVAPNVIKLLPYCHSIFSFCAVVVDAMCPSPAHIAPSTISPHWLIPSLASEGILLKAIRAMNQSSHPRSPLLIFLLHHRHARLPKKPSRVLHAERKNKTVRRCIPSDEIWQKLYTKIYVRAT